MARLVALSFVLFPLAADAESGGKVPWVNWKTAQARARATGLPILVYAIVDAKGNGC